MKSNIIDLGNLSSSLMQKINLVHKTSKDSTQFK